ncbi:Transcriptional regulator, ArsR family [Microbacterium esteraromaticum]|uniref:Transcriptional regulator, ArsR family n=1 Tax=Microbacterium esteraromaticum TaxID=57043 RepID=A0A1R4IGX8_9MICO|nr:helix-turn-helix domain-containing protein [Microbacterium esteraromaticum]SJN18844.1 Transcriptional regulator, ArsR family [Microbacterium esteraromaticum]
MENDNPGRTLDAGALKALAHPIRVRIYDVLSEQGPQTASTLAVIIGETSGSTSYHLRALAAHDLIKEVRGRGTARERWWERPRGRINLPGPDETQSPANRAAAQIVTAEFFRLRHQTLMNYLNRPANEQSEEWRDAGLVLTTILDLTVTQMQELQEELSAVVEAAIERYRGQEGQPGVRRVSLRAEIFDLPTPSTGRAASEQEPQ